ncbi:MAG: hypothetical protein ACRDD2_09370 [Sarcina sp.]
MILKEINITKNKEKISLSSCKVLKNGLKDDAKGGKEYREISIFIDRNLPFKGTSFKEGLCTKRFKANLVFTENISLTNTLNENFNNCSSLNYNTIKLNSIIKIGTAILKVNPIKKKCFPQCTLNKKDCPLLSNVFFCSVLQEGEISINQKLF